MLSIAKSCRRALLFGLTGLVSVVVTACYGMVYTFRSYGRVLDRDTGEALPDIRVRYLAPDGTELGAARTDLRGDWAMETCGPSGGADAVLEFADTDGEAGGGDHATVTLTDPRLSRGGVVEMERR